MRLFDIDVYRFYKGGVYFLKEIFFSFLLYLFASAESEVLNTIFSIRVCLYIESAVILKSR